jgi:hypothetical protein
MNKSLKNDGKKTNINGYALAQDSWRNLPNFFRNSVGLVKVFDFIRSQGLDTHFHASTTLLFTLRISKSHRWDSEPSIAITDLRNESYEVRFYGADGTVDVISEQELLEVVWKNIVRLDQGDSP